MPKMPPKKTAKKKAPAAKTAAPAKAAGRKTRAKAAQEQLEAEDEQQDLEVAQELELAEGTPKPEEQELVEEQLDNSGVVDDSIGVQGEALNDSQEEDVGTDAAAAAVVVVETKPARRQPRGKAQQQAAATPPLVNQEDSVADETQAADENEEIQDENVGEDLEAPVEAQDHDAAAVEEPKTSAPADSSLDDAITSNRIFVTRISFEVTKDDLEHYFSRFGTIVDAYCPRQQGNPHLNKGFGFISFQEDAALEKVFQQTNHVLLGREIIVDRATGTKHHSNDGNNRRSSNSNGGGGYGYNDYRFKRPYGGGGGDRGYEKHRRFPDQRNRGPSRNYHTPSHMHSHGSYGSHSGSYRPAPFDPNKSVSFVFSGATRQDVYAPADSGHGPMGVSSARGPPPTSPSGNGGYKSSMPPPSSSARSPRPAPKLFIGRISFDTTVHSMRAYFSRFGEIVDAYIPRDAATQRSKGFGFLTFASKHSVHAVLEPNIKHVLDGKEIIVDYADMSGKRP